MIFLLDHHLEGQAKLLLGTLAADGWLDLETYLGTGRLYIP